MTPASATVQLAKTRWRACMRAFERVFGKARSEVFMRPLIPMAYDSLVLFLRASSPWHLSFGIRVFAIWLRKILGHSISALGSIEVRARDDREQLLQLANAALGSSA